jgi:DNA-binding transcriptional ArsR family regulator
MVSNIETVSGCLKALSDPTRLGIVTKLKQGELSVHEVAEQFPMSRPAISKHLRILREAGLVAERAEGRARIYSIDIKPLSSIQAWLAKLGGGNNRSSGYDLGGIEGSDARTVFHRPRPPQPEDWKVW